MLSPTAFAAAAACSHTVLMSDRYIEIFLSSRDEFLDRLAFETYPQSPYARCGPPGPYASPGPFPPKMRFNPLPSTRPTPYDRFSGQRSVGGFGGPAFDYRSLGLGSRGPAPPGASRRPQVFGDEYEQRGAYPMAGLPAPPPPRAPYAYPPVYQLPQQPLGHPLGRSMSAAGDGRFGERQTS